MATKLSYQNNIYALQDGETVLDGLLRHGQDVPNSCKAGACQSCLMKAQGSSLDSKAQEGLKETLKAQNFFLACQCVPDEDMDVSLPSLAETTIEAEIIYKEQLCHNVVALRLKLLGEFSCRAGQYISILRNGTSVVRSYSVSNLFEQDGFLELHIRRIESGAMSVWACDEAKAGDKIHIRGPAGDCFYLALNEDQSFPLLLAGTGTGLAPLEGVVLDALKQGHKGDIHILHGALKEDDLYHVDMLQALSEEHGNLIYTPCILNRGNHKSGFHIGPLDQFVMQALEPLDKTELRTYFCGAPDMVNLLKKKAFLAGVSSKNIFSDPFLIRERKEAGSKAETALS